VQSTKHSNKLPAADRKPVGISREEKRRVGFQNLSLSLSFISLPLLILAHRQHSKKRLLRKKEEQKKTKLKKYVVPVRYNHNGEQSLFVITGSSFLPTRLLQRVWGILPERYQIQSVSIEYSISRDGTSLLTLLDLCNTRKDPYPLLLIVKDSNHHVFGAFLTEGIKKSSCFYGTGESFLFKVSPTVETYPWTRQNELFTCCNDNFLAVGCGGEGSTYGLWIHSDLLKGSSSNCDTFENDVLSSEEFFDVLNLEVWGFNTLLPSLH